MIHLKTMVSKNSESPIPGAPHFQVKLNVKLLEGLFNFNLKPSGVHPVYSSGISCSECTPETPPVNVYYNISGQKNLP